jgi:hypothetical protein
METKSHILKAFPFLQKAKLEKDILESTTIMVVKKDETIVQEGQYLKCCLL